MHKAGFAGAAGARQPPIGVLLQHQPERLCTELWNQLPVHVLNHLCSRGRQGHPVLLLYRQLLPKLLAIAVFGDLQVVITRLAGY